MMEKICIVCGKEFKVSNWNKDKKYCSHECYWKKKKKNNNKCEICGKETYNKYCSKKCYGKSQIKEKEDKFCKCCGKTYISNNKKSEYCSRECYWNYRNSNPEIKFQTNQGINLISKTCTNCGNEYQIHPFRIEISSFCCKKCHYEYHNIKKICPTCKKEFIVPKYLSDRIYCSNSCVLITRDSKFERDIKEYLSNYYSVIKTKIKLDNRTIFPDININNKIVECYGDYWHCNPIKYDKDYYHKQLKKTAQDVWLYDKNRIKLLKENGYDVLIIWENEWDNKDEVFKKINNYYEIC